MAPTVLVADEDQDTRIILRSLLERQGFAIIEANNAADAVANACDGLSLVILNHPMSVREDLSLAAWLREQPATSEVPIINLTSRAIPLLIEDATRQGVNVTITKPLDAQVLMRVVRDLT
jgi:CheY-like chemotaxis protein